LLDLSRATTKGKGGEGEGEESGAEGKGRDSCFLFLNVCMYDAIK